MRSGMEWNEMRWDGTKWKKITIPLVGHYTMEWRKDPLHPKPSNWRANIKKYVHKVLTRMEWAFHHGPFNPILNNPNSKQWDTYYHSTPFHPFPSIQSRPKEPIATSSTNIPGLQNRRPSAQLRLT